MIYGIESCLNRVVLKFFVHIPSPEQSGTCCRYPNRYIGQNKLAWRAGMTLGISIHGFIPFQGYFIFNCKDSIEWFLEIHRITGTQWTRSNPAPERYYLFQDSPLFFLQYPFWYLICFTLCSWNNFLNLTPKSEKSIS